MLKKEYRPDIDGLRAFAVICVIIFHTNNDWLSGGFVGVDMFFVISGYIITSMMFTDITNKNFSFKIFYLKRIKRILPLFYTVSLSSIVLAWFIFAPDDLISLSDSLRYGSSFISNVYFERHSGYFAPASETLPLLHIWSLSIEEQFYLIWPILLFVSIKFFRKNILLLIMSLLVLIGCVYSQYLSVIQPSKAYYLIQSRYFELLLGALVAVLLKMEMFNLKLFSNKYVGIISLFILCFFTIKIDKNNLFPGLLAFVIATCTCVVIINGDNKGSLSRKLLSNKYVVFVGTISYSLYLWHWPILAFYRYYNLSLSILDVVFCWSLTLLLSITTWVIIEKPFRFNKINDKYIILLYLILPIILSVSLSKVIDKNNGFPDRFSLKTQKIYNISEQSFDDIKNDYSLVSEKYIPFERYKIGDQNAPIKAFIWGDSHGGHYRSFVEMIGKEKHFSAIYGGLGGCPPLLGVDLIKNGKPEIECTKMNNELAHIISKSDIKTVYLAARWAMYSETTRAEGEVGSRVYLGNKNYYSESIINSRKALRNGLFDTINFLLKNNKKVIIFEQVPSYPFLPVNCLTKKESNNRYKNLDCNLPIQVRNERQAYSDKLLTEIQSKYPSLSIITVDKYLCNKKECLSEINGIPLYKDNNHLNYQGGIELYKMMYNKL